MQLRRGLLRGQKVVAVRLRSLFGSAPPADAQGPPDARVGRRTPADLRHTSIPRLRPLVTYPSPADRRALIVLGEGSGQKPVVGGAGTAFILGALLAERLEARLRVVTRGDTIRPAGFASVLRANDVAYQDDIEFVESGLDESARAVSLRPTDLLLTTSWAATWSALRTVAPDRIVYLVREDERGLYPLGDEALLCREVLCDDRLRFVVDGPALYDHLVAEGMAGVAAKGIAFDPAFPSTTFFREERHPGRMPRFVLFARPRHPGSLFLRGVEAVAAAIETGALDPDTWDFHIVGEDIPDVELPRSVRAHRHESPSWPDYAALVRSTDLGLSLLHAPQPGYPPRETASSGGVAVTNHNGGSALADGCRNIIEADLSVASLTAAFATAAELALDDARRDNNFRDASFQRDWRSALAETIAYVADA
jgi:hypothetical protein